jgi:pyruvyl transferase EpsI
MNFKYQTQLLERFDLQTKKTPQRIFLFGSPIHQNLGDHAISIAEIQFIQKNFPNYPFFEIFGDHFLAESPFIPSSIKDEDIILITGGGFMGDLWIREENLVREIIKTFPNNPIIILPQTIFFQSEDELNISRDIYKQHENLFIFAREPNTLKLLTEKLEFANCKLAPDMVLSLELNYKKGQERNGVLSCLREDKESILTIENKKEIRRISTKTTSMITKCKNTPKYREMLIKNKLKILSSADLVITDRLHCVLLCILTKTKYICIDNISGKVLGVTSWIKDYSNINILSNINIFSAYFDRVKEKIKSKIGNI